MKKHYLIASALLCILTAAGFFIATINEDFPMRLFSVVVFTVLVLMVCFPAAKISRRMIGCGDSVRAGWKRVFYYVSMFALSLVLSFLAYLIISGELFPYEAGTLGQAVLIAFSYIAAMVVLFIPFMMSMIVLVLRKIISTEEEEETFSEDIAESADADIDDGAESTGSMEE